MPYVLHPSGYCIYFNGQGRNNLIRGHACPYCKRIAGHSPQCPDYKHKETIGLSSRPKFYDASSVLWGKSTGANMVTFTMPSLSGKLYQRDLDCPETGDLAIAAKFSKVLEAWSLRSKRAGEPLSYTWVSERQEERRDKYGGVGELHYHILVNQKIKSDQNYVVRRDILDYLQYLWCDHLNVPLASNCVDVRPLPEWVRSVPPYMAKYLGKGARLPIRSRRFGASRDLTRLKPIHLATLPEHCTLEATSNYTTADGFDITAYYFNTRDVLDVYSYAMYHERLMVADHSNKGFTPEAVLRRAIDRQSHPNGRNIAVTGYRVDAQGFIQPDLIPTDHPKKSTEKAQRKPEKAQRKGPKTRFSK